MLALMFNTIEAGAKWPKDLKVARAAFMSKGAGKYDDPLNHRVLTILPVPYRRWAIARLYTLKPWISNWDFPQVCAGGIGKGAQDGWYRTATQLEHHELNDRWYTGGAIDIRKCFDQMPRTQLYTLAKKTGMPQQVLQTYMQYQEELKTYNTVQGGLGQPYSKRCGIPQGDPLSMMMVALYLRPWVQYMETEFEVTARVLAEDMLIIAHGADHI